jgi:hypothetical protein
MRADEHRRHTTTRAPHQHPIGVVEPPCCTSTLQELLLYIYTIKDRNFRN